MDCTRARSPVLVIEDDDDTRGSLKMLLELKGFRVVTARDGSDGLEVLEREGGACMILLDWMMPIMSGREFLDAIVERPRFADIPVLVVTAFAGLDETIPARHLRKPVPTDRLLEEVSACCASPG